MSVYTDCVAAGIQVDHHESDLYVPVCEAATAILKQHGMRPTVFVSQTGPQVRTEDGQLLAASLWYDVPFAYDPWWEAKQRHAAAVTEGQKWIRAITGRLSVLA